MEIVSQHDLSPSRIQCALRDIKKYSSPQWAGNIDSYRISLIHGDIYFWVSLWNENCPVAYCQGEFKNILGKKYICVKSIASTVLHGNLAMKMHEFLSDKFNLPTICSTHLTPHGLYLWGKMAEHHKVWLITPEGKRIISGNDVYFKTYKTSKSMLIM